jgi:hypothetical protein
VTARYCKGYATEALGCAESSQTLSDADFAAFTAALATMAESFGARAPGQAEDIPVGGGSSSGRILTARGAIYLPAFPAAVDAPPVAAAMALLQSQTPAGLIEAAEQRARQP